MSVMQLFNKPNLPIFEEVRDAVQNAEFTSRFNIRSEYTEKYSYSLYTLEEVQTLVSLIRNKNAVEIGCGTGFLLHHLRKAGASITGVDNYQTNYATHKGHKSLHSNKVCDDIIQTDGVEYIKNNDVDVIILVWPDYSEDTAFKIAKLAKRGAKIFYKGEGRGGCTADDNFHEFVDDNYHYKLDIDSSQRLNMVSMSFDGMHDDWHVYEKL